MTKSIIIIGAISFLGDCIALWWTFHGRRQEKENARKLDELLNQACRNANFLQRIIKNQKGGDVQL